MVVTYETATATMAVMNRKPNGHQLGLRIPDTIYRQLLRRSKATGITVTELARYYIVERMAGLVVIRPGGEEREQPDE